MTHEQPYGGTPPHQAHSETSLDAAESMSEKAPTIRDRVFRHLLYMGDVGATDEQIQLALDITVSTEVPRRRELQLLGKIKDSGNTRKTTTKRTAVVWVVGPPIRVPEKPARMARKKLLAYVAELEERNELLEEENQRLTAAIAKYEERNGQGRLL